MGFYQSGDWHMHAGQPVTFSNYKQNALAPEQRISDGLRIIPIEPKPDVVIRNQLTVVLGESHLAFLRDIMPTVELEIGQGVKVIDVEYNTGPLRRVPYTGIAPGQREDYAVHRGRPVRYGASKNFYTELLETPEGRQLMSEHLSAMQVRTDMTIMSAVMQELLTAQQNYTLHQAYMFSSDRPPISEIDSCLMSLWAVINKKDNALSVLQSFGRKVLTMRGVNDSAKLVLIVPSGTSALLQNNYAISNNMFGGQEGMDMLQARNMKMIEQKNIEIYEVPTLPASNSRGPYIDPLCRKVLRGGWTLFRATERSRRIFDASQSRYVPVKYWDAFDNARLFDKTTHAQLPAGKAFFRGRQFMIDLFANNNWATVVSDAIDARAKSQNKKSSEVATEFANALRDENKAVPVAPHFVAGSAPSTAGPHSQSTMALYRCYTGDKMSDEEIKIALTSESILSDAKEGGVASTHAKTFVQSLKRLSETVDIKSVTSPVDMSRLAYFANFTMTAPGVYAFVSAQSALSPPPRWIVALRTILANSITQLTLKDTMKTNDPVADESTFRSFLDAIMGYDATGATHVMTAGAHHVDSALHFIRSPQSVARETLTAAEQKEESSYERSLLNTSPNAHYLAMLAGLYAEMRKYKPMNESRTNVKNSLIQLTFSLSEAFAAIDKEHSTVHAAEKTAIDHFANEVSSGRGSEFVNLLLQNAPTASALVRMMISDQSPQHATTTLDGITTQLKTASSASIANDRLTVSDRAGQEASGLGDVFAQLQVMEITGRAANLFKKFGIPFPVHIAYFRPWGATIMGSALLVRRGPDLGRIMKTVAGVEVGKDTQRGIENVAMFVQVGCLVTGKNQFVRMPDVAFRNYISGLAMGVYNLDDRTHIQEIKQGNYGVQGRSIIAVPIGVEEFADIVPQTLDLTGFDPVPSPTDVTRHPSERTAQFAFSEYLVSKLGLQHPATNYFGDNNTARRGNTRMYTEPSISETGEKTEGNGPWAGFCYDGCVADWSTRYDHVKAAVHGTHRYLPPMSV